MSLRSRCHEILDAATPGDRLSRLVDIGILCLILLNIAALILETVPHFREPYGELFHQFEMISLLVFTGEYLLRVWSIVDDPDYAHPVAGRLRFMLTPMAMVDLAAVLPTFLGLADLRYLRVLRLLKLARYIESMRLLQQVVIKKRAELGVTLLVICILLIFTSCLIYAAEYPDNPQFASIPAAMWWSIVTLTTVGYGDTSPTTPMGQVLAGFIAILGIGMFALPTSILGAAFVEEMEQRGQRRQGKSPGSCPHCGKDLPRT